MPTFQLIAIEVAMKALQFGSARIDPDSTRIDAVSLQHPAPHVFTEHNDPGRPPDGMPFQLFSENHWKARIPETAGSIFEQVLFMPGIMKKI